MPDNAGKVPARGSADGTGVRCDQEDTHCRGRIILKTICIPLPDLESLCTADETIDERTQYGTDQRRYPEQPRFTFS